MARMTASRRSFGVRPGLHVESMDRESLLIEAIYRHPFVGEILGTTWIADDDTCRFTGWQMAQQTGTDFRIGRRLLQLTAPGGYLLPPKEFRLSRVTEPTEEEIYQAPFVAPWSVHLWQSGSTPAEWRVNGSVYHKDWEPRIWSRLLYLHRDKSMALTADGWVKLGRRM
jgi:hypothetical protein